MLNFEIKNHLESNLEYSKEAVGSNALDVNNCLFTPELLAALLRSYKDESTYYKHSSNNNRKMYKNEEGVYVIAFKILNKEKKSLVYNYVYYNDLLYLTLIVYFMIRNAFITQNDHE
jgi:hypothetical protein